MTGTVALTNKSVWLITGCSSGLGAALAKHTLHSGHRVVATARHPSTLAYLPDINDVPKLPLDVTSKSSIADSFVAALAKFGRIDYVVNNSGYGIFVETEATKEEEARQIFETNFWGSVNVAIEAVKVFREMNPAGIGGMLIQISSLLGRVAVGGQSFYSSSKFAIEGFIETLSKELPPKWNIKVLIAEPGAIKETAFIENIRSSRDIHPAYKDPDCPTNKTRAWIESPDLENDFPTTTAVAVTLFDAIVGGDLPLRLPLGRDSWEGIYEENLDSIEVMKKWQHVSERPASFT